jgi:hypothetical protein
METDMCPAERIGAAEGEVWRTSAGAYRESVVVDMAKADEWVGRAVSESDDKDHLCMHGAIRGVDGAGMGDRGVKGESGVDWAKLCLVLLLVVSSAG